MGHRRPRLTARGPCPPPCGSAPGRAQRPLPPDTHAQSAAVRVQALRRTRTHAHASAPCPCTRAPGPGMGVEGMCRHLKACEKMPRPHISARAALASYFSLFFKAFKEEREKVDRGGGEK